MPGERGVLADRVDPDADRGVGRDGPGDHSVADGLGDRLGLAGDHRLVQLGGALDDLPVRRDPGAGAHQHDVTDGEVVERDRLDLTVGTDPLGLVREERGEGGERVLRLTERLHLLPVAEQHDRDEQRQLPPEVAGRTSPARWPATPRRRR